VDALVTLTGRRLMGRVAEGRDLLNALAEKCKEAGVSLGEVRGVGALSRARVACFDQPSRRYEFVEFEHDLNLAALNGNISLLYGKPILHAHMVLVDDQGRVFGGQLVKGCRAYAVEYVIVEYTSQKPFEREYDETTGLMLWKDNG